MTHHGPDSEDATTILPIVYSTFAHGGGIQMALFPGIPEMESRSYPECVPVGLLGLWTTITPRHNLGSRRGLNQSCSPCRDLSNDMSHLPNAHRERVDSRLLMVGSQTASSTPDPSFAHNLGCRCPNDQCEAIFNIYALRPFQWHQKNLNARCFGPFCRTLNMSPGGLQVPNFGCRNPNLAKCGGEAQHLERVGIWSPSGLPNVESSTARGKTPCIGAFLVSLKRSWNVDIENGLTLVIWTSAAQVRGKRRAESQIGSLTPDH